MKFKYQARNKNGELQVGYVEASNKNEAVKILTDHGLFVLSIENEKSGGLKGGFAKIIYRVKAKDLMIFTRQLATLIESEIPLNDALNSIIRQTKNPTLKEVTFQIMQDVESGLSFSQALGKRRPVFSDFYISMIRSAEVTGRLEEATEFLADYMEKEAEWHAKLINALIYPAVLLSMFIIVAGIMVVSVFPKLAPVFEESNVQLPWATKLILNSGNIIINWWWIILAVIVLVIFMIYDYFNSKEGKVVASQLLLVSPVFGKLFKKVYITRFARSFSVLIKGGIPMTQAIEIAADTIGNEVYREILFRISQGVREGAMFSKLLSNEVKYFPIMVGQMVAVGETTGRLEQMMTKVASFYDEEVNSMMDNLGELIQPLLILIIGVMVGVLFASILLPIYNLAQSFNI